MSEVEELKRIIEILDQEGVDKCEKLEKQAKRIKELEKALDKACEELSRLNNDLDRRVITTSTYWKEYLLKEVQEDEQIKQ